MDEMTLPQFLNELAEARRAGKIQHDPYHGRQHGETQLRLNVPGLAEKSRYCFCPIAAMVAVKTGEFIGNSFFTTGGKKIGLNPLVSSAIARAADEYNDRAVGRIFERSSLRVQLDAALGL